MANLSDENFMAEMANLLDGKATELPLTPDPAAAVVAPVIEPVVPAVVEPVVPAVVEPVAAVVPPVVEPVAPVVVEPQLDAEGKPVVVAPATPELDANGQPVVAPVVPAEPDYKAIHQRIFGTPFKAAGQEITVNTPEEAISLMQKGVGFHSKLNKVQGDLKYVEMLRNNNLLDESNLSLLIDAHQGKPGALKKLLDAAKVDPLTLDSAEASAYAPSDHRVTDEQVRFQSVVDDLSSTQHGQTVLQEARGWDQASKAEVYKTPDVLGFLAQQKEMGRYDVIKAEVNRQKVLGYVPVNEGFLASYTRVGQQMMQAGAFGTPQVPAVVTPTPVTQKTITPIAPANAAAARVAAPTKTGKSVEAGLPDIKAMSDADFETHFKKTLKI